jgi:hypothetical protein
VTGTVQSAMSASLAAQRARMVAPPADDDSDGDWSD